MVEELVEELHRKVLLCFLCNSDQQAIIIVIQKTIIIIIAVCQICAIPSIRNTLQFKSIDQQSSISKHALGCHQQNVPLHLGTNGKAQSTTFPLH